MTTVTTGPAIAIERLTFAYDNAPVLQDVNLSIQTCDFVCVVGPNGGGKTTLLRLILGLLTPASGTIRVFGQSPLAARQRIGYMPQRAQLDPQFPARVKDVTLMGRLGHGRRFGPFSRADKEIAAAAIQEVGLTDLASRPFAALSGGQRQRVLIARALACQPDILLLDEPTANLDPLMQDDLYELLRRLNERLTVILVSHDVGFVSRYVKTVVCVNRNVAVHCASDITGQNVREIYGHAVHMVHHDHVH